MTEKLISLTSCVHHRLELARLDKHKPSHPREGICLQLNTLNQFHSKYIQLAREFSGPRAMCGYFSPANAFLLSEYLVEHGSEFDDCVISWRNVTGAWFCL